MCSIFIQIWNEFISMQNAKAAIEKRLHCYHTIYFPWNSIELYALSQEFVVIIVSEVPNANRMSNKRTTNSTAISHVCIAYLIAHCQLSHHPIPLTISVIKLVWNSCMRYRVLLDGNLNYLPVLLNDDLSNDTTKLSVAAVATAYMYTK